MERLTTRVEDKVYYSKGEHPPTTLCAEMETHEIRECMKKLAEYEDTGLKPSEITSLKEHLDISRSEVQGLSGRLVKLQEKGVK